MNIKAAITVVLFEHGLASAAAAAASFPTVHMPLDFKWGADYKISTALKAPGAHHTIDVCYDLGSSDFFLFRPGAIQNWGLDCLLCQGQCNRTVPEVGIYDPSKSPSASSLKPWHQRYGYSAKIYDTSAIVNDTFTFSNEAGYSATVPDVEVALAYYMSQRIRDTSGTCSPVPTYDFSIMGISPYYTSNNISAVEATVGPSFRHGLLENGLVSNTVQSMWFEKAPPTLNGTYTGSGLQGGLDTSKFSGKLVKIPSINATTIQYSAAGYYIFPHNLSFVPADGTGTVPIDRDSSKQQPNYCLIDSGSVSDGFVPANETAFLEITGLKYNPKRPYPGQMLSWPAPCESIPTDDTVPFLKYSFAGVNPGETVEISMPLRSYVRHQLPEDTALGWCTIRLQLGLCSLSSPFSTRVFFAADDDKLELAFAQGGVAERGSCVDYKSVVATIP